MVFTFWWTSVFLNLKSQSERPLLSTDQFSFLNCYWSHLMANKYRWCWTHVDLVIACLSELQRWRLEAYKSHKTNTVVKYSAKHLWCLLKSNSSGNDWQWNLVSNKMDVLWTLQSSWHIVTLESAFWCNVEYPRVLRSQEHSKLYTVLQHEGEWNIVLILTLSLPFTRHSVKRDTTLPCYWWDFPSIRVFALLGILWIATALLGQKRKEAALLEDWVQIF